MSEVTITVEVEVNPTEDLAKVKAAVENLFKLSSVELLCKGRGSLFNANAKGKETLGNFYTLLRQERILNAARRVLIRGTSEDLITFCVNKQAAYMKHISFCEPVNESPLGPIKVEIKTDETKALIDWLAPRTG